LAALLPAWKQEFGWPSDVPAQALQQSLKDLDQAYINFFKDRANSPVFRKKSKKDSDEQTSCNLCAGSSDRQKSGPHYRQSDYSPGGICEDKRIRGAAGMGLLRQRAKGILQRQRRLLAVC
jgi:transposase